MIKQLTTAACLALAVLLLAFGGTSQAQTAPSLNGVYEGETSGNQVRVTEVAGGIEVTAVTSNPGQRLTPTFFRRVTASEFRHRFPNGAEAVASVTTAGDLRVRNPDGWTDLFQRVGAPPVAPAVAAADDLDGVWVGDASGNRVTIARRSGGIDVAAVGPLNGRTPAMFFGGGSGEYRYTAPQGGQAIVRVLSPGRIRVSYPDGWSDIFQLEGGVRPADEGAPYQPSGEGLETLKTIAEALASQNSRQQPPAPPAAAAKPPRAAPEKPVGRKPRLVMRRQDGPSCLEYTMTVRLSDDRNYWFADFKLQNNCGQDILMRWDAGEALEGEDGSSIYVSTNSHPFTVGGTWVYWKGGDPAPLTGFPVINRLGEGVRLPAGAGFSGSAFQQTDMPVRDYVAWLVACPAFTDKNGVRVAQSMFLSKMWLRDGAQFTCLPNIPFNS